MNLRVFSILIFLTLLTLTSCGQVGKVDMPGKSGKIVILSLYQNLQDQLPGKQIMELQRVIAWMEKDLTAALRDDGFETLLIREMADYNSAMGTLFIINSESFNAGTAGGIPSGEPGSGPSSLEVSYRVLDERGALLAEWRDGALSRRGGTYCASTLNRRALKKLESTLDY